MVVILLPLKHLHSCHADMVAVKNLKTHGDFQRHNIHTKFHTNLFIKRATDNSHMYFKEIL